MHKKDIVISVIGLGYVGLPVAVAFSKSNYKVIGFDLNKDRISELLLGIDRTNEVTKNELKNSKVIYSSDKENLKTANFHIITVPTPIDEYKNPNLDHIKNASETLGKMLKKNDIVIIESTVFPGVTEDIVTPILEKNSNLKLNKDFSVGYSPERINPADKKHRFENIKKVISASNSDALKAMKQVYCSAVKAGTHSAPSIKVAEAAKVIENTQRDLNIAFMNELVKIFNSLDIDTNEVLDAAGTKWNFLPFRPGFVGGHCIGVDPYYLIHKSQQVGVIPDLLLSARKINDGMSSYFVQRILKVLNQNNFDVSKSRVLILGLSFKENCPDIRNSKIMDLILELKTFNLDIEIFDPIVDFSEVKKTFNLDMLSNPIKGKYDLVVITVPHLVFKNLGIKKIRTWCKENGLILDLKNTFPKDKVDYTV